MRLEQFRYVLAIANCKSLSKAARDLFLTQPTLSVNLQNIEAELGFALFHRSRSGMELTEKGAAFCRIAQRIENELDQIRQLSAPEEEGGEVFLAAVPAFCNAVMLPLLTRLKQTEPELVVHIQELKRGEILPLLMEHQARLGIGIYTEEEKSVLHRTAAQNRIIMEPLLSDRMRVYLPKHHPLAFEPQVRMSQLEEDTAILLRNTTAERQEEMEPHSTQAKYYSFSERESVMRAVSKGMGYAVLPGLLSVDNVYVETGLVSVCELADEVVPVNLFLAYSALEGLTRREKAVIQVIHQLCDPLQSKMAPSAVPEKGSATPPGILY